MFIIIYPSSGEAKHSLLGKTNVISIDDDFSLKGFLLYCYSTIAPMFLHDKLESANRKETLYKLCCFHYALVERSKYGFMGWSGSFNITTVNLESAVNLFKELCERWVDINFSLLYSNVLEVAYLSDVVESYDIAVFQVLAQWIFVGINKHDDQILDNLQLRSYNGVLSSFIELIKNANYPKDHIICGLHERVTRPLKWRKMIDAKNTIKKMFTETNKTEADKDDNKNDSDFRLELSSDNLTSQGKEGINHCIENEICALEKSKKYPKRYDFIDYIHNLLF
jgi:hypothetical protein